MYPVPREFKSGADLVREARAVRKVKDATANAAHVQHFLDLTGLPHGHRWTREALATLLEMDAQRAWTQTIADTLGKTYGQVRWMRKRVRKLSIEQLAVKDDPDSDDGPMSERDRAHRSDDAFQHVMREAIRCGLEHAPIGVFVDDSPPRSTPLIRPGIESGYRSVAGMVAELGGT